MNILICKKFNNYFNRIVKKYSSFQDYVNNSSDIKLLLNINFNPSDGVRTDLVLGQGQLGDFFDFESTNGADYLVAYEGMTINDNPIKTCSPAYNDSKWWAYTSSWSWATEDPLEIVYRVVEGSEYIIGEPELRITHIGRLYDVYFICEVAAEADASKIKVELIEFYGEDPIKSRWFITEADRTRAGQYKLQLKRDTIVDNFDSLINCPAFIKKGSVSDDNPLIYNDEGISVNQIKTSEELLKDKAGTSWIVGYIAKNVITADTTTTLPDVTINDYITMSQLAMEVGISESKLGEILTIDNDNNPYEYINGNITQKAWINVVDNTNYEAYMSTTSSDYLDSFSSNTGDGASHNPTTDCFAKTGATGQTEIRSCAVLASSFWKGFCNSNHAAIKSNWKTNYSRDFLPITILNKLTEYSNNNKLVYAGGKYYSIKIANRTSQSVSIKCSRYNAPYGTIFSSFVSTFNDYVEAHAGTYGRKIKLTDQNRGEIFAEYTGVTASAYLKEVTDFDDLPGLTANLSASRNVLYDEPYDMFAIPANIVDIKNSSEGNFVANGVYSKMLAMKLVEKYTTAKVYDVQLLPYCPIPKIVGNNELDLTGLRAKYDYDYVYRTAGIAKRFSPIESATVSEDSGEYVASIVWVSNIRWDDLVDGGYEIVSSQGTPLSENFTTNQIGLVTRFNYTARYSNEADAEALSLRFWGTFNSDSPVNENIILYPKSNSFQASIAKELTLNDSMKIDNLCDNYRICSPNYQGSFDFNVAKNGGLVQGFIASCTYKPYTPYIKVAPLFGGLYGDNYGDARGCICSGDFSIGLLTDKWQEYQLQNKNYQNIFNRDIQNLETMQGIQREQSVASAVVGTFQGAGQGAMTGAVIGGGYGAAIGAVAAGTASGLGGAADIHYLDMTQEEQRKYAIDKYRLNIGNIKALPYTLTKVGIFNADSKIWPFLEYYTCTDVEKQALKNKIEYEGMTIGIVDYLEEYIKKPGYLQADLIRNNAVIEDSHQLDDVYIELTKGVYL